jgi:CRP/FNR family transcriptional regulator, anaerobic regulatory protein
MFSEGAQTTIAGQTSRLGGKAFIPPAQPTLQSLFGRQPIEKFEAGTTILWEGDAAAHIFEVTEGVLRIFRILSDGRRVITGFLYPGDILGVSLKDRYLYSAEAVTPTRVRRFTRNRFQEEIDRSPELRPQLFSRLCDEMAAAQDQMVLLARKNAEERVCSFLLLMARRMNCDQQPTPVIEIAMTRLDMADYLGLTIETVSRTMTKLTNRGVIASRGRRGLKILKFEKLLMLAGDGDEEDKIGSTCANQAVWPN